MRSENKQGLVNDLQWNHEMTKSFFSNQLSVER